MANDLFGLLSPDTTASIGKFLSPDIETTMTADIERLLSPDFKFQSGDILSPKTSLSDVLSPKTTIGDILSPKTSIMSDQMGLFNLKGSLDTSKKAMLLAPQYIINSPFASQKNTPETGDSTSFLGGVGEIGGGDLIPVLVLVAGVGLLAFGVFGGKKK